MEEYFEWYKSMHIISVISWMAAIFYMPRLFVYHTRAQKGGEMDKTLQEMERKLLRIVMNPSMVFTYIFGFLTAYIYGFLALGSWFYIKLIAVFILTVFHMFCAKWRRDFQLSKNRHSERFFRIINELPVFCMVIVVLLVVIKPFE